VEVTVKVALVQHEVAFEDPAATCGHLAPLVEAAAGQGAQLVVLTEMFATGGYDLRFADLFWALATSTDCYLLVANWPSSRQVHFRALAVARAIENQAYVLATNRVGTGGGLDYAGGTIAVGPLGEVLAEAGDGEETLLVDVSAARGREVREAYPFLADRRPFSVVPIGGETLVTTDAERAVSN
jgi:predicted amidohydrolase